MPNEANCSTCGHKKYPDGGWCYMFKTEPLFTCLIHTASVTKSLLEIKKLCT